MRVHIAGKFSPDCWSDTLNHIARASDAPAMDSNGNIIDSFRGQQVVIWQDVCTAVLSGDELVYIGAGDVVSENTATVAETEAYLGIG